MEIRFPLILDGATGTELQKRGYGGDVSAEQWTLEHPDVIVGIQRGYVAAGSQVLYTPTFGANRQKLEERSIFNQTADYNRRLAALSREAAGGKAWIAGDLAPTGLFLAPLGEASFEDLVDIYTEQAAGLEAAGVDLYVIETMMTLSDARAAVLAVRSVSDKPIFVSFTCDESGRSLSGTDVTAALTVLQGMGISAFGLNCSTGPDLEDRLADALDSSEPMVALRVAAWEDIDALTDVQYLLSKPLCLVCDDAELLEAALRAYQGRALYEGTLPEAALLPLCDRYGLLI